MMKWIGLCISTLAVVGFGFALANCGDDGGGGECKRTADCQSKYGDSYYCDLNSKTCVCSPACSGKCCGDDGCGGTCPNECSASQTCNASCECENTTPDCTNGQTRCNDNVAEVCQGEAWAVAEDCTVSGATCVNGVCEGGTCTNGTYRCNGNTSELCTGGAWGVDEACTGGETCDPVSGRCTAAGCTDGQVRCNGTVVQNCTGGSWVDGQDCAPSQVCSAGACIDPGSTHPGAGDVCKCESADSCSIPCPSEAGSASTCLYDANGDGICSFECAAEGDCLADFADGCCNDLGGTSYCLPNDYCITTCTDPVNQVGCDAGENCVPVGGTDLACAEAGDVGEGGNCDDAACQAGLLCVSGDPNATCLPMCNTDTDEGCAADEVCGGLQDVDTWGVCQAFPDCDPADGGAACGAGETCIIYDQACSLFKCYPTYGAGIEAGGACEYLNECVNGLLCITEGASGVCRPYCSETLPECVSPLQCFGLNGCPETFGVCSQE